MPPALRENPIWPKARVAAPLILKMSPTCRLRLLPVLFPAVFKVRQVATFLLSPPCAYIPISVLPLSKVPLVPEVTVF